jgi:hypothetical protein
MHEKPGRRIAVSDDAIGTDAEYSMGHLLVGRDPASRVWPPTKLRKHGVETSRERG